MNFSHIATIYFIMGVLVVAGGVVPVSHLGIASAFVDVDDDLSGGVDVDRDAIGGTGEGAGLTDNLISPIANALDTITGGALLAVWTPLSAIFGFYAWPVMTTNYIEAPAVVVLLSGLLVMSFTFGLLRVFKASI